MDAKLKTYKNRCFHQVQNNKYLHYYLSGREQAYQVRAQ